MEILKLSVSDFVALLNQTLEFAYPSVEVAGELANFRVSKNKWVYFDLKDEFASVKCFGTVYTLPGPLEDGMLLEVKGSPRLHPLYGFSITVQSLQPVGEGSIKRAQALLLMKLEAEGLFDPARKRPLPYPPARIGLIASVESAAYADFIKILNERWAGLDISLYDVQVQGEAAIGQVVGAIEHFNQEAKPVEVLVITRGGGSAEDLAAFSTEQVARAVAASRIPTLVAIGHEVDISLAELAADQRASTPSNAAQLLVPDKSAEQQKFNQYKDLLIELVRQRHDERVQLLADQKRELALTLERLFKNAQHSLDLRAQLLAALNPLAAMQRGFAIVSSQGRVVKATKQLKAGQDVTIRLSDGEAGATISSIKRS